jgi:photosystem II stability/assembly factor-like uncharacterized protein
MRLRYCIAAVLAGLLLTVFLPRPAAAGIDRWTRVGPSTGLVLSLAAAPSRPSTIYASLAVGGLFRSLDGGASWSFAGKHDSLLTQHSVLAVDPSRPEVVYAGTPQGLLVTLNGGDSWRKVRPEPVVAVAVTSQGAVYFASSDSTVFLSTDRGEHWTALRGGLPLGVLNLTALPGRPRALYAGTYSGLYKSLDGGLTWTRTGRDSHAREAVFSFAIDPRSPQTFYAVRDLDRQGRNVFRSTNGGETWELTGSGPGNSFFVTVGADRFSTVYAITGFAGVLRSFNRGQRWERVDAPLAWTLLAGSQTVLLGNATGVYRSSDRGSSWAASSQGLDAAVITGLAIDRLRPLRLYAGDSAGNVYRTSTGGGAWDRAEPALVDFSGVLASDPNRPGVAYAGLLGNVAFTRTAGANWNAGPSFSSCVQPEAIAIAPGSSIVYMSGDFVDTGCSQGPHLCNLFKSVNRGETWSCTESNLGNADLLAAGPAGRVYVSAGASLYVSTDAGATWNLLSPSLGAAVLAIDPQSPDTLYAGLQTGGVARSTDGGQTWLPADAGLPATSSGTAPVIALEIDPVDTATLYAATPVSGVFKSVDAGASWTPLGTGLRATIRVKFLALDPRSRNTLYVGTSGAGVMKLRQSTD